MTAVERARRGRSGCPGRPAGPTPWALARRPSLALGLVAVVTASGPVDVVTQPLRRLRAVALAQPAAHRRRRRRQRRSTASDVLPPLDEPADAARRSSSRRSSSSSPWPSAGSWPCWPGTRGDRSPACRPGRSPAPAADAAAGRARRARRLGRRADGCCSRRAAPATRSSPAGSTWRTPPRPPGSRGGLRDGGRVHRARAAHVGHRPRRDGRPGRALPGGPLLAAPAHRAPPAGAVERLTAVHDDLRRVVATGGRRTPAGRATRADEVAPARPAGVARPGHPSRRRLRRAHAGARRSSGCRPPPCSSPPCSSPAPWSWPSSPTGSPRATGRRG